MEQENDHLPTQPHTWDWGVSDKVAQYSANSNIEELDFSRCGLIMEP